MKGTAGHWTLKLNKKVKICEILHLSWAVIPGMGDTESTLKITY